MLENMKKINLDFRHNGGEDFMVFVTFVDETGFSIFIPRGARHGGDIRGFIPAGSIYWQAYLEPYSSTDASRVEQKHFTDQFPHRFI